MPTVRAKSLPDQPPMAIPAVEEALPAAVAELQVVNASAAVSLAEALEESLTLHRLEAKTHRVTHWRTSDQKLRWCAAALGTMERQVRRVKGYRHLPLLKHALTHKLSATTAAAA